MGRAVCDLCVAALFALCCEASPIPGWRPSTVGYKVAAPDSFVTLNSSRYGATLQAAVLSKSEAYHSGPLYLLNLSADATRYQQGFDAGFLTGDMGVSNYYALVDSILTKKFLRNVTSALFGDLVDWQWRDYLSKEVPQQYLDELEGMSAGGKAAGVHREEADDVGVLSARAIVLANLPGDIEDFKYILEDEWHKRPAALLEFDTPGQLLSLLFGPPGSRLQGRPLLGHCSMLGVWGSRTRNSSVFTGRNLDWNANTGINKFKLVTVYNFNHSAHSHATIGYAGLAGALTGLSTKGVSVHEANLEEEEITFRGFPWLLRLRYIMENAATVAEAVALWNATNNTAGFNHGIGAPADGFVVLETRAHYSAVFKDDDPREMGNASSSFFVGHPMKDALWRTNHGYDPAINKGYLWNKTHAGKDSQHRYNLIQQAIEEASGTGMPHQKGYVDVQDAVNVTAIVGHKNDEFFKCVPPFTKGSNVISAAYDLNQITAYAAWEDKGGAEWTPAACNTYIKLNLRHWFAN